MSEGQKRFHFNPEVSLGNLVNVVTILAAAVGVTWSIQEKIGDMNTKTEVNSVKIANQDSRLTQEVLDRKSDSEVTRTQLSGIDSKVQTLILMQTKDP